MTLSAVTTTADAPQGCTAARPALGTWCIIVLVKKYPLYDRAMWSPTAYQTKYVIVQGVEVKSVKSLSSKFGKNQCLY